MTDSRIRSQGTTINDMQAEASKHEKASNDKFKHIDERLTRLERWKASVCKQMVCLVQNENVNMEELRTNLLVALLGDETTQETNETVGQ